MNINTLLDIILNKRLGLVEYNLSYLYPEIHKNLLEYTLPIFSQYFPCYRRYEYQPNDHKTENRDEYYLNIPEIEENGLQIISVAHVVPQTTVVETSYFDGYRPVNLTIEDVIMNSVATNTASLSKYSFRRFKFIPPNRLMLRGYGGLDLSVTVKIAYPSFSAIPDSVIEQFLDLATADTKIYVYNKLKHYEQIQLPIGNIDLKLDNLQDGDTMRENVIERFNTKGFPNKAIANYYRYE